MDSKTALSANLEKAQSELDARGFDLLQEEFNYDMQCFEVFLANRASHATAVLHQKNLWNRKLLDESRTAADAWWERYVARLLISAEWLQRVSDVSSESLACSRVPSSGLRVRLGTVC